MTALYLREIEDSPTEEADIRPSTIKSQQALVVGINHYPAGFRSLENALSDARELAGTLQDDYGFELLPSGSPLLDQRATRAAVQDTIRDSLTSVGAEARWLFFFAGHGKVIDGVVYLVPADATYGDTETYLSLNWLLELCRDSQPQEILILLDACYSGWAMVRGESLDDLTPNPDEVRVRQIISSGNPRQPVLDAGGKKHSVFTQALLDGLQGWSGIHEPDGRIRFARLLDHLVYEIPGRLRAAGFDTFHQQPIGGYFVGNRERREFVFYATVDRLPPDILRDIASQDPGRRTSGLRQMSNVISNRSFDLALSTQAIQIAAQHVQSHETTLPADQSMQPQAPFSRAGPSIEPVPQVRSQAVTTLGELILYLYQQTRVILEKNPQWVEKIESFWTNLVKVESDLSVVDDLFRFDFKRLVDLLPADSSFRLVEAAQAHLKPAVQMLIAALDDSPEVSRQAARALGKLSLPVVARPILDRLTTADPSLFLDLVDAIGAVGNDPITAQALKECLRMDRLVPFVGPDFPTSLTGLPDRKTMIQELGKQQKTDGKASLAETAAGTMRGPSRHAFTAYLRNANNDPLMQPGEIHQEMARLKAPFWISGTYDNLLGKALEANVIVMGGDTRFWKTGQPTVVRLVGDPSSLRGLVVIEDDYKQLRESEGDRRLLLSFIREELEGKVALFLGYDPDSPDFSLLVQYVLNEHLLGTNVRAFLVWPEIGSRHTWGEHPIHVMREEGLELVKYLNKLS